MCIADNPDMAPMKDYEDYTRAVNSENAAAR